MKIITKITAKNGRFKTEKCLFFQLKMKMKVLRVKIDGDGNHISFLSKIFKIFNYFCTVVSYFIFVLIFITFLQNFANTEPLFCFEPDSNFENWIVSKLAKHENAEIVFFHIALVTRVFVEQRFNCICQVRGGQTFLLTGQISLRYCFSGRKIFFWHVFLKVWHN